MFQVTRGDIRDDWRRRKCWCGYNPTDFLQRIKILKRDRDNSDGYHDHMLYPPNSSDLLSAVGRDVLWSVDEEQSDGGGLLLVRMEFEGEGERLSLGKREVC